MNTQTTMAEQFRAEYAKGVVPAMLHSLDNGRKRTKALLYLVMAVTYWHVASYLVWHTAFGWFGFAVPLIVDLSMLQMLDILQTRAMRKPARTAATAVAAVLGLVSGTFNVIAADDAFTAFGFASLVVIAVATKVVASLMGPDFNAIEQAEQNAGAGDAADAEAAIQVRIDEAVNAALAKADRARKARERREAKAREALYPVSPATVSEIDSSLAGPIGAYEPAYL